MSDIERTWPIDAFDAVSIAALGGQFEIEGYDGDQVILAADIDKRAARDVKLEPVERWLNLHFWESRREAQMVLRLPRKKAWVIDVWGATGQIEIKRLDARLRVMLGKGDVEIKDCRGSLTFAAGKASLEIYNWSEMDAPARPPVPQVESRFEMPPIPEGVGSNPVFQFRFGRRGKRGSESDVFNFDAQEWTDWGSQVGQQARAWAQQFVGQFIGQAEWPPEKDGLALRLGKGDAELRSIVAKSCDIHLASGDLEIEDGRIDNFNLTLSNGDVECESVLPVSEWDIEVHHGDLRLALPSDTRARLDVATRHGDIDSEIPFVRVGRPGPEARHGGRMVGTVGQGEGQVAEIKLTSQSGDIKIEWRGSPSKYAGMQTVDRSAGVQVPPKQNAPADAQAPIESHGESSSGLGGVDAQTTSAIAGASIGASEVKASEVAKPAYDSQLAILQALSQKEITVEEAEKLLQTL